MIFAFWNCFYLDLCVCCIFGLCFTVFHYPSICKLSSQQIFGKFVFVVFVVVGLFFFTSLDVIVIVFELHDLTWTEIFFNQKAVLIYAVYGSTSMWACVRVSQWLSLSYRHSTICILYVCQIHQWSKSIYSR